MKKNPVLRLESLEDLYHRYNRREYVHPDPLEFLYGYPDIRDREIVGLIASSLAYGRVAQILRSVGRVLDIMGPSPHTYLSRSTPASLRQDFAGFVYRFARSSHLVDLMLGIKRVIGDYGSLQQCLLSGMKESDENILPGLSHLTEALIGHNGEMGHLIPLASRGSSCKRLNLFLRWMIRKDDVDMGGWADPPPSKLIIPLDVHMHRFCRNLACTERKQADMRTALDITDCFREINPEDPVRYDFSLTRLGIRSDLDFRDHFQS